MISLLKNNLVNYLACYLTAAVCVQRLSMALGNVFFVIAIIIFLYLFYCDRQKNGFLYKTNDEIKGYYKALLVFIISLLPSVFCVGSIESGIKTFLEMWIYRTFPFFAITMFIHDKNILKKMFIAFIVSVSLDCLVATYQYVFNLSSRGWGVGGNVLNLASILCFVVPIIVIIMLDNRFKKNVKIFWGFALACCSLGVLAGQSRGAWLTIAVLLPVLTYRYLSYNKKYIYVLLLIVTVLASMFVLNPTFQNRLLSITNITTDRSNADRIIIWESSWNMFKAHSVIGVGLGQFRSVYNEKYKLPEVTQDLVHSHNNIVQIVVESGIIGLLGFFYLIWYIFKHNFYEWYNKNNVYALLRLSCWLGILLFGMIDYNLDASAVVKSLWFLYGIFLMLDECYNNYDK